MVAEAPLRWAWLVVELIVMRVTRRTLLRHSGTAFESNDVSAEQYARQAYQLCRASPPLSLANIFVAGPDRIGARGMQLPTLTAAAAAYQRVASDVTAGPQLITIANQRLAWGWVEV